MSMICRPMSETNKVLLVTGLASECYEFQFSMRMGLIHVVCIPGVKLPTEFHVSLGRTVPIRIHQVDTMVYMLR